MAEDWTDTQNDKIVAAYIEMLRLEREQKAFSKADYNRQAQAQTGRARGAVEFKLQNVSVVLMALGLDWIRGYKPAVNYQASLEDAVARALHRDNLQFESCGSDIDGVQEEAALWFAPPPTLQNAPPPRELQKLLATARKFDVAARDARNRALGRAGEARVLRHERRQLLAAGREDLVERIRWVSDSDGDGAGYDIRSFDTDGRDRLIEVKTTTGWERTPFYLSRNELAVATANAASWRLVRLWNFARAPAAFELQPPLDAHLSLIATTYEATPH